MVKQYFLTIRGIKGRAILDAGPDAYAMGTYVQKGILVLNGHDIVVDNLELRNAGALVNPNNSDASGIRIQDGTNAVLRRQHHDQPLLHPQQRPGNSERQLRTGRGTVVLRQIPSSRFNSTISMTMAMDRARPTTCTSDSMAS